MPRELWLGNVQIGMTEGLVTTHFNDIGLPHPYKVVLRTAPNGYSRYAIATWQTVDDATAVMSQEGIKWPDGRFMIIRLVYNGTWDNQIMISFVVEKTSVCLRSFIFCFQQVV